VTAAAGDDPEDPGLVSLALSARSRLRLGFERFDEVRTAFGRALRLARAAGDLLAEGRALAGLGYLRAYAPDSTRADEFERALELHRESGDIAAEAMTLRDMGTLAHNLGRREEARALAAMALERVRELGNQEQLAISVGFLGLLDHGLGRTEAGLAKMDEAIASLGGIRAPPHYLVESGFAAQELGLWDDAEARYRKVIAHPEIARSPIGLALAHGYLASLYHERSDLEQARLAYEVAIRHWAGAPACSTVLIAMRACYGALLAKLGNIADATRELESATATAAAQGGGELAEYVAVHRGHLDRALAREREAVGDTPSAELLRAQAAARLDERASAGEDLRFARRLLAREVQASRVVTAHEGGDVLLIGHDARWFRFRGAPVVELGKRGALRLVFLALVHARIERPGQALSVEALVTEGWRGERMSPRAGKNRLHVALSDLRAKGLREAIASRWDGYLIAPTVRIVESDTAPPADVLRPSGAASAGTAKERAGARPAATRRAR
jgi:tetratricopeptide (TPR) repeat protein